MNDEIEEVQCRTCLAHGHEMLALKADHVVCLKVMPVLTLLKSCTSVEIELNDAYPQHVCLQCMRKVESAFEFRQQCEETDKSLRSPYKIEILDDDSDIYEEYEVLDDEEYRDVSKEDEEYRDSMDVSKVDKIKFQEIEIIDAYPCAVCDLIFPTEKKLQAHANTKHPPNFFQCPQCPVRFITQELLDRHVAKHSSKKIEEKKPKKKPKYTNHSCSVCDLIFPSEKQLQAHVNKAHPRKVFQCPECPERFMGQALLDQHVTNHQDKKLQKKKNDHNCTKCERKFNSASALRLHSRIHQQSKGEQSKGEPSKGEPSKEEPPKKICEECGEHFNSEEEIKLHFDRIHSKIHHCKICFKVFPTHEALDAHTSTHYNTNTKKEESNTNTNKTSFHKMVYKCKTCAHEGDALTHIKDHLTQTHKIDKSNIFKNLLYTCSDCQKDFPSIYEFFDHTNEKSAGSTGSTKRKNAYVCTVAACGKGFPSVSALKSHSRSHETHWPKKCKYCDTIVGKLPEYIRHLNDQHEQLKKFNCKTCDKKFFSARNLKTHSSIHSGERNYMCDYCGFSFHAHNNLVSHRRIHEGIKPYKCTYCPVAFSQYAGLRSHLLNHTQEKKYECPICNRKFLRHSAMKNHIKTHTGQKDYMCHVCGARFGASSSRKKHLLTHTGERNHVCDFCGKAFGRKSNLTVHRKIHTGETPHVCDVCGKGFIQKHVLRSHMVTHEKSGTQIITTKSKRNAGKRKQLRIDEQEQMDAIEEELTE